MRSDGKRFSELLRTHLNRADVAYIEYEARFASSRYYLSFACKLDEKVGVFYVWVLIGAEQDPQGALTKLADFLRPWLIRFPQQKVSVSILRQGAEICERVGHSRDADFRAQPLPILQPEETRQVWAPVDERPSWMPPENLWDAATRERRPFRLGDERRPEWWTP